MSEEEVDPTRPLCTEPEQIIGLSGRPGIGKSTLASQAARWLWREKKLRTRLLLTDAGSFSPYAQGIEKGYIDHISADAWDNYPPHVLFKLLAEGWWPEDPKTPNSRLIPGYTELRLCTKCGGDSGSRGAAQTAKCASCGEAFPAGTRLPISRKLTSLAGIGMLIGEGLTKVGDMLLSCNRESRPGDRFYVAGSVQYQELARKANDAMKKQSPTEKDGLVLKEAREAEEAGYLSLAKGGAQDHWLKADGDLQLIIHASKKIPVPYVIWTFHEGRWEESTDKTNPNAPKKLLGLGPVTPVMKRMAILPGWFSIFGRVCKVGEERMLMMEEHQGPEDPSGKVKWVGKINTVGAPSKLKLEDALKVNNFANLMKMVEEAKGRDLP